MYRVELDRSTKYSFFPSVKIELLVQNLHRFYREPSCQAEKEKTKSTQTISQSQQHRNNTAKIEVYARQQWCT